MSKYDTINEIEDRYLKQIKQLEAENARLRAALQQISDVFNFESSARNMARIALKGQL